jgi:hypothetical protein
MNPATTTPSHPRPPVGIIINAEPIDAEPIDVRRIRLMQPAGASAVVSEFRTADQVLDRWIGRGRGTAAHRAFTFEITFVDGYILSGCYEFWRGARRRPSLARWVRGLFSDLAAPPAGAAPVDISRYALDTP